MPKRKKTNPISLSRACRVLHPKLAVLITCIDKAGKANIITLAWCMPVSIKPPLLVVSIAPRRHSHKLIEETKEFVVNIPTMKYVKETLFCGRRSGKGLDKFKETKFTPLPAKTVKAPIIKECIAHLECKLYKKITAGDHTLFIGEILDAYANKNAFTGKYNLEKAKLIFHVGGNKFASLNPEIVAPRLRPKTRRHRSKVF
jgi:flavin reductase (DIM6/NTAB) family NADH-FMN oxidoreductase RutF